jgi:hypothetical protein
VPKALRARRVNRWRHLAVREHVDGENPPTLAALGLKILLQLAHKVWLALGVRDREYVAQQHGAPGLAVASSAAFAPCGGTALGAAVLLGVAELRQADTAPHARTGVHSQHPAPTTSQDVGSPNGIGTLIDRPTRHITSEQAHATGTNLLLSLTSSSSRAAGPSR